MCNNFPNIKVVKGNAFALLMPLKKRTFESCEPIDEDIDATQLTDLVVKFGGVQYQASTSEDGVQIIIPADIAVGTYSIVLTAMYQGSAIRAAYESALTIVQYNSQSDAQQYIAGSPIVLDAAYVIGGTLTDAELEALKEEYREKNAQLDQAIADAEEAKREWEQKAADLDGVAQESTSHDILTAVENIDIDTSDLAKEDTAQEILQKVSVGADALEVEVQEGKAAIVYAIEDKGGTASTAMSLTGLAQAIDSIQVPTLLRLNSIVFENAATNKVIDMSAIEVLNATALSFSGLASVEIIRNIPPMPNISSMQNAFSSCANLVSIIFGERFDTHTVTNWQSAFGGMASIRELDISMLDNSGATTMVSMFNGSRSLEVLNMRGWKIVYNVGDMFGGGITALREVDMRETDASLLSGFSYYTIPYNCVNLTTLVGGISYEEVVAGNVVIYNGLNVNCNSSQISSDPNIDRASLRAIINGLADRTGQSAFTFRFGATLLAKLSAEDIAVATNKNWTLA